MMEIPIGAEVNCVDGPWGSSVCVIIDPVIDRVTHLVVQESNLSETQRMVPFGQIIESNPHFIRLDCTRKELEGMPSFVEAEHMSHSISLVGIDPTMLWPYSTSESGFVPLEHDRISPNGLEVHRGARVEAKDGRVGKVDEFLVEPENGNITHLVLREGHLWGQKEISIPISDVDKMEKDIVYLKVDKGYIDRIITSYSESQAQGALWGGIK